MGRDPASILTEAELIERYKDMPTIETGPGALHKFYDDMNDVTFVMFHMGGGEWHLAPEFIYHGRID